MLPLNTSTVLTWHPPHLPNPSVIPQASATLNSKKETLPPPKWIQLNPLSPQKRPLSVAIEADGLPYTVVQKALTTWEQGTQYAVQFQLLNKKMSTHYSDILFYWATETNVIQADKTHPHSTGKAWLHVKPMQEQPIIIGSTIELTKNPSIDNYLSKEQQAQRLYTTILHEIGHALGLKHAKSNTSIMHPMGWRNTQLTTEDILLFQVLYGYSSNHLAN
jgi:hypothetical protein